MSPENPHSERNEIVNGLAASVERRAKFEILRSVIVSNSILVVNTFARIQASAKHFRYDNDVLRNFALFPRVRVFRPVHVNVSVGILPSFPAALALSLWQWGEWIAMAQRVLQVILTQTTSANGTRTVVNGTRCSGRVEGAHRTPACWIAVPKQSSVMSVA